MRTRSWVTSLIITSVFAAPAQAGTITRIEPPRGDTEAVPSYVFRAAPGEANDIVVERLANGALRFTDAAAPPAGCAPESPRTVLCAGDHALTIEAGDGDDRVNARGVRVYVKGGPGADELIGGNLAGDAGDDVLVSNQSVGAFDGGPGRDHITGGTDTDTLIVGDGEPDVVDGGGGVDFASYETAPAGVRVDLALDRASDGDVLAGVELVFGSRHADHLLGDDGPNGLHGGPGDDRLEGRGAGDRLLGGEGLDVALGGEGNDTLQDEGDDRLDGGVGDDAFRVTPYGRPVLRCGPGRDTVETQSRHRVLGLRDCEIVHADGLTIRIAPARLTVAPRDDARRPPCRIRVTIGGRVHTLRRPFGTPLPVRRPATVRLRQDDRCRGAFKPRSAPSTLRLH